jgi:hypothetical protein
VRLVYRGHARIRASADGASADDGCSFARAGDAQERETGLDGQGSFGIVGGERFGERVCGDDLGRRQVGREEKR